MNKKENLTYDNFQSCFDLNVKNVEMQRQLATEKDEEKIAQIQACIEENQQAIADLMPTSRNGICSCKSFISNTLDSLKVALFVEEHPAAAERINVFIPENLTKEEIDIRSEALRNMTEQVSEINQGIEIKETGAVPSGAYTAGTFFVEGN